MISNDGRPIVGDAASIETFDLARRLVKILGGPEYFDFDALRVQGRLVPGSEWIRVELSMHYRPLKAPT